MNKTLAGVPLDHLGVAVVNLEAASLPYTLLGLLPVGDDETVAAQRVRVRTFRSGDSFIELLEPTSPESPIQTFLDRRGPGLHHLALRVIGLETEVDRLKDAGARFISEVPQPGRHRTRVVFLHPKWTGGVLVELVEHP